MIKCFWCSNKAIHTGYTCSPTSASGMTTPKPYCADCSIQVKPTIVLKLVDHDEWCTAFRDAYHKIGEKSQYDHYKPKDKEVTE